MIKTKFIESNEDVLECFPLMKSLRPNLNNPIEFLIKVKRQQNEGYKLLALFNNKEIVSIVGYRELENFHHGKFIYIDDMVANSNFRSSQYGHRLYEVIIEEAKFKNIDHVVLDSGVNNTLGQRFFYFQGLIKNQQFSFLVSETT
jgi:hypothetical protein